MYSYYIDDMIDTSIIEVLRRKFTRLASELNERGRRRWAASEALELGHGGIKVVARSRWDAAHVDVASSASRAGAIMIKTGQPSSPGSVARGQSSSKRRAISP